MTEAVPGGWLDEPRLKPADKYLTNAAWVGAAPGRHMEVPYGLGNECWYVTCYKADEREKRGYGIRRIFAGMDRAEVNSAARQWAADGFPYGSGRN